MIGSYSVKTLIEQRQAENIINQKINEDIKKEQILKIKSISEKDIKNILSYIDNVAKVASKYQQENLYYIDFFNKNNIITTQTASYYNKNNTEISLKYFRHLQSRKELINSTYKQITNGFIKTLSQSYDNADVLNLISIWKSMYEQDSAYVSEELTDLRKSILSNGEKTIEANAYVAEHMKTYNNSFSLKIN
ncbi:hypothetical protein GW796_00830 [archaeon]|nr:hypothetical protein [archaeon]NCQ50450.1 hypothetical protein [archaeon]